MFVGASLKFTLAKISRYMVVSRSQTLTRKLGAIDKEVMEVTLKPVSQTVTYLWSFIAPRNSWAY